VRARCIRTIALCGLAISAALLGSGQRALASAGCDAVNGTGFNDTVTNTNSDSKTIPNFAVGDTLNFTITMQILSPPNGTWQLPN
jgi:hypothetical protein